MTFRKILFVVVTITSSSYSAFSEDGETIFKTNCASCHTIGNGKLVGPDLKDIDKRHSEAWLLKWIKASQALVKSGDKEAVAVFTDNNKIPMTDFGFLSDEQIKSLLGYVQSASSPAPAVAPSNTPAIAAPAPAQETAQAAGLSFIHYVLIGVIVLLLFITWMLSRVIKKLSNELVNSYKTKKQTS